MMLLLILLLKLLANEVREFTTEGAVAKCEFEWSTKTRVGLTPSGRVELAVEGERE